VVFHVLEHKTSLDVDGLIVGQSAFHVRKHSQGVAKVMGASEHQPKVKHRADEVVVAD